MQRLIMHPAITGAALRKPVAAGCGDSVSKRDGRLPDKGAQLVRVASTEVV
jgi:hypothetical protein